MLTEDVAETAGAVEEAPTLVVVLWVVLCLCFAAPVVLSTICATFVTIQKFAGGVDKVILHHADEYQAKSTKLDWPWVLESSRSSFLVPKKWTTNSGLKQLKTNGWTETFQVV